jgi:hypothetical protein
VHCNIDLLDEVPFAYLIKKNECASYGALSNACLIGPGLLMENRSIQDGTWEKLVKQYEIDGYKNVSIKKLKNVITTLFHCHHKDILFKWIQDYGDVFT